MAKKATPKTKKEKDRILKGIKDVSRVLAKVAEGDLSNYCNLTGDENFDALVLGVNFMISDLKERESKISAIIAQLEEAKAILEVRVKARTGELERLNKTLEQQVEERTKELQTRMEESERINKLMVGRELEMIELKKEITELRDKLEKKEAIK